MHSAATRPTSHPTSLPISICGILADDGGQVQTDVGPKALNQQGFFEQSRTEAIRLLAPHNSATIGFDAAKDERQLLLGRHRTPVAGPEIGAEHENPALL